MARRRRTPSRTTSTRRGRSALLHPRGESLDDIHSVGRIQSVPARIRSNSAPPGRSTCKVPDSAGGTAPILSPSSDHGVPPSPAVRITRPIHFRCDSTHARGPPMPSSVRAHGRWLPGFFALLATSLGSPAYAAAPTPGPALSIKKAPGPIKVDGALDDPGWQGVDSVTVWFETRVGDNVEP